MICLIQPNKELFLQYKDMMDEWKMEGFRISPWPLHMQYNTVDAFNYMVKHIINV